MSAQLALISRSFRVARRGLSVAAGGLTILLAVRSSQLLINLTTAVVTIDPLPRRLYQQLPPLQWSSRSSTSDPQSTALMQVRICHSIDCTLSHIVRG